VGFGLGQRKYNNDDLKSLDVYPMSSLTIIVEKNSGKKKCVSVCYGDKMSHPTKMAISEILVLVGIFFGPHEENHL